MNLLEKKAVSFEELDAQNAFELPNREMLLITVVITNLLNNLSISIPIQNNNVAVQVCAVVELISTDLLGGNALNCDIQQRTRGGGQ
jgi:hypothetical protein